MPFSASYRLLMLLLFCPFVLFTGPVSAIGVPLASTCGSACRLALSHQNFPDVNTSLGYYPIQCGSDLRILSTFVCMRSYCAPSSIAPGWKVLNIECQRYGNITLPDYESVVQNVTDDQANGWLQIDTNDFNGGPSLNTPVSVSRALFDLAYTTKKAWNDSVSTREAYGHALLYFWTLVILIGTLQRLLPHPLPLPHNLKRLLHLHLTIRTFPAQSTTSAPSWYTPRAIPLHHTLLLALFFLLNLLLSISTYPTITTTNLYWPPSVQRLRYISDRTGVLATCNLPLLWLFSTRNSLVLYLTNWSFDTAMVFHRWIARVATVQALVHSLGYIVLVGAGQGWAGLVAEMGLRYWVAGLLGMGAMGVAWVGSVGWVRVGWYEAFLVVHVAMAVGVIWGMWWHVDIFEEGGYLVYLWICGGVWVADRMLRALRVGWVNWDLLGRGAGVVWDEDARVVMLDVPIRQGLRVIPGEYYFVYLLHGIGFWESHPFTVASWSTDTSKQKQSTLKFLVRPYDGFTKRLRDLARQRGSVGSGSGKVRVLVEGPYGPARDLSRYDQLVFVVGGSGVAVALAYLTDFLDNLAYRDDLDPSGNASTTRKYSAQRLTVVWMVKTPALFDAVWLSHILPLLDTAAPSEDAGVALDFQIHVTGTSRQGGSPSEQGASDDLVPHHRNRSPWTQMLLQQETERQSEHSPLLSPAHSPSSSASASASGSSTPTPTPAPPPSGRAALVHEQRWLQSTHDDTTSPSRRGTIGNGSSGHGAMTAPIMFPSNNSTNNTNRAGLLITHTRTHHENQRPDISSILHAICSLSRSQSPFSGSPAVGVVSCGPQSLADATRCAVRDVLERQRKKMGHASGKWEMSSEGGDRVGSGEEEAQEEEEWKKVGDGDVGTGRHGDGDGTVEVEFFEESYSW